MNRRHFMMLPGAAFLVRRRSAQAQQSGGAGPSDTSQVLPDQLLLRDYRPKSVYKIPVTPIEKAKYPIIDVHHHARAKTPQDVEDQVKVMDKVGVEKTVAFSGIGAAFDRAFQLYSKYPNRFDVWCGLDMTDVDQPGFGPATVKELERCRKAGAVGVGEITDKGMGIGGAIGGPPNWQGTRPPGGGGSGPRGGPAKMGLHPDDPRMDPVWQKCADLGMPINLHMSDPYWSYLSQDKHNDGLMNGFSWRMDDKPGIMGHNELIESLERTVKKHSKTVFIACHLANLDYDLTRLSQMLDRNPNLFVDISARFAETAPIPRFASQFLKKYAHRVCYGTDMPYNQPVFSTTFRILESLDEHFYAQDVYFNFNYHWPLHGFGLPDDVLKKVYREAALAAFKQARNSAKA
ncbi:MAG TPA: amidohydrolase family protein [Acidobacteriota bacterium]|nr:amidohydrolase family protein [Acidobacteriota bacterium]